MTNDAEIAKYNYRTPVGLFQTWESAAAACERCDFDAVLCIEYVGGK